MNGAKTILYPTKDLDTSKAVLTALLGEPMVDQPYYVGWQVAGQDVGLVPNDRQGLLGATPFWHVDDLEATLAAMVAAGASPLQEIREVSPGRRTASVRFEDGNVVGLLSDS